MFLKQLFGGAFVCALLTATSTSVFAANITFNDLTDLVTLTTSGDPASLVAAGDNNAAGEFLHYTFTSTRVNSAGTVTFNGRIFDPDGLTVSDWFAITATNGSNQLDLKFYSDPATFPSIAPNGSFTEDGTSQQVLQYFGGSATAIDTFFVASDRETPEVPEPVSLLLLGTGLTGLIGRRLRRSSGVTRI